MVDMHTAMVDQQSLIVQVLRIVRLGPDLEGRLSSFPRILPTQHVRQTHPTNSDLQTPLLFNRQKHSSSVQGTVHIIELGDELDLVGLSAQIFASQVLCEGRELSGVRSFRKNAAQHVPTVASEVDSANSGHLAVVPLRSLEGFHLRVDLFEPLAVGNLL